LGKVAITRINNYEPKEVEGALTKAMETLEESQPIVPSNCKVLLKVNLILPAKPERAITTHPEIVRAAIRFFKARGCDVSVGDSPFGLSTERALNGAGIMPVIVQEGAKAASFDKRVTIKVKDRSLISSIQVAAPVAEADVIVNMPKLKTHGLTGLTLAVKNTFGCIIGLEKSQYHIRFPDKMIFSRMLIDLHHAVKPVLNILDGGMAIEGEGPSFGGKPRWLGALIVGENAHEVDAAAARMTGFEIDEVSTLAVAVEKGFLKLENITFPLCKPEDLAIKNFVKSRSAMKAAAMTSWPFTMSFFRNAITATPYSNENCILCGECIEHCPAGAISEGPERVLIDEKRCIRCYCCIEICPHGVMSSKRGWLQGVASKLGMA